MKKNKKNAPETPEEEKRETAPGEAAQEPQPADAAEPEQAPAEAAEEAPAEAGIDEWRSALETAVAQRDSYLDSLRRTQADFQNFKRRNQTARADGYADGVCDVAESILPAIDNLERALAAANPEDPLASGVQMTLKLMEEGLRRFGLEEVPALGETFDPEKHNAVMREAGGEPGKVLEVFQKGYRVKDRIIRYAMVKVAVEE
ncbi:MAG: nucleotide exchange factor GrpE [Clostridia bacterium]|nr:nucleotide exchange factor GrpE [Clostridia bacterium]